MKGCYDRRSLLTLIQQGEPMTMKIPILRVEGFLIVSIQVALDDRSIFEFQQDLLQRVTQEEAAGVVIDLTTVDIVDSFMARSLNDVAVGVHLLGAELAIVGIQPHVAITLVEMCLTISKAITALNLEKGLQLLRQRLSAAPNDKPVAPVEAKGPKSDPGNLPV